MALAANLLYYNMLLEDNIMLSPLGCPIHSVSFLYFEKKKNYIFSLIFVPKRNRTLSMVLRDYKPRKLTNLLSQPKLCMKLTAITKEICSKCDLFHNRI